MIKLETERLSIYPASQREMLQIIDEETDEMISRDIAP